MCKNRLLAFLLALPLSLGIMLADTVEVLKLTLKTGNTVTFELSKRPEITFSEEKMKITAEEAAVEYPFADIDGFAFENVETGISQTKAGELRIRAIGQGEWSIDGDMGAVKVCDLSGKQCPVVTQTADSHTILSLTSLPAGVYLVTVGSQTFKLVKP